MARYIDADKFEDAIKNKEFFGGFFDNNFIYNELHRQPTADVIPKEFLTRKEDEAYERGYAEAKREGEGQRKHYHFDAQKADESLNRLLANAKTEVAREIFEEIDKLAKEGGVIWTNYARAVVAELKKKYIEERDCPDCRYFEGCETACGGRVCDQYTEREKK